MGTHPVLYCTILHTLFLYGNVCINEVYSPSLLLRYVVSTRIRAARNISGYGLPAGATDDDRESVKNLLVKAFSEFGGDLKVFNHSIPTLYWIMISL